MIQNFAPGAFDRLVGIDALLASNPRLIVGLGSGYGSTGPYSSMRAMDLTIQAMSGAMATTGFEDSAPVRTGPAVVDFMGGSHLFGAVMAALVQRGTTGQGQHVEVALYDAILPSLASNIGGCSTATGRSRSGRATDMAASRWRPTTRIPPAMGGSRSCACAIATGLTSVR